MSLRSRGSQTYLTENWPSAGCECRLMPRLEKSCGWCQSIPCRTPRILVLPARFSFAL